MILTFICTSTTGSATKLDALEYQLGSSSYPKENKAKKELAKLLHDGTGTWPWKSYLQGPPIFSQRDALLLW